MASRSLADLNDATRMRAELFLNKCQAEGIEVLIYCTYRSDAEQDQLYAQGRTLPGKIVTNAKAGQSEHNKRRAFDCVPMLSGKPQWGDVATYRRMGEIGESVGLEWAGRWTGKLRETAHFQFRGE
jgi:peptidoglycan L-alanyl-D-glutamate endopeptidase CwlK